MNKRVLLTIMIGMSFVVPLPLAYAQSQVDCSTITAANKDQCADELRKEIDSTLSNKRTEMQNKFKQDLQQALQKSAGSKKGGARASGGGSLLTTQPNPSAMTPTGTTYQRPPAPRPMTPPPTQTTPSGSKYY